MTTTPPATSPNPNAPRKPSSFAGAKITATDIVFLRQQVTADPSKATCPKCLALIAKNEHEK